MEANNPLNTQKTKYRHIFGFILTRPSRNQKFEKQGVMIQTLSQKGMSEVKQWVKNYYQKNIVMSYMAY